MTKFMQRSFSVSAPMTKAYGDNYDRIFGKKPRQSEEPARCSECAPEWSCFNGEAACHKQTTPAPTVSVRREELVRWIATLERVSSSLHVAAVREAMKMVLAVHDGEPGSVR